MLWSKQQSRWLYIRRETNNQWQHKMILLWTMACFFQAQIKRITKSHGNMLPSYSYVQCDPSMNYGLFWSSSISIAKAHGNLVPSYSGTTGEVGVGERWIAGNWRWRMLWNLEVMTFATCSLNVFSTSAASFGQISIVYTHSWANVTEFPHSWGVYPVQPNSLKLCCPGDLQGFLAAIHH